MELMKKSLIVALTALTAGISCAQQALPQDIVLLNGEVTLRYTPNFEARCTKKSYEKKSGDFFGERKTTIETSSILEVSPGVSKFIKTAEAEGFDVRLSFDVNEDGTGLKSTEPDIQFKLNKNDSWNSNIPGVSKEALDKVKLFLGGMIKTMGDSNFSGIGQPLRQGSSVMLPNLCEFIPEGRTLSTSGGSSVAGTAVILGRENIIFSSEQTATCIWSNFQMNLEQKGWYAVDRQSGLRPASSLTINMTMDFKGFTFTSTEDIECTITGAPTIAPQPTASGVPGSKSVEQRLSELKSLFDKGLITKEQFEKKRDEVLKSL